MTRDSFHSLESLRIDPVFAPGWSLRQVRKRKAFLVRLEDRVAWIAAVDPLDVSAVDDLRWLTKRDTIRVLEITSETLDAAVALFAGA